MDIGELNRRVEILQYFADRDDYGGEVGVWRPIRKVWASIQFKGGKEYLNAQQVKAEHTTVITMRYDPTVDVLHRIRYRRKVYEIIAEADEDTSHEATVLNCKEIVNGELQRKATESESGCHGSGETCPRH